MFNNLFLNINFVSSKLNFSNTDIENFQTILFGKYAQFITKSDKTNIQFQSASNNFFSINPGNMQIAMPTFDDAAFSNLLGLINEVNRHNGFDRLSLTQVSFEKITEKNKNVSDLINSKGISKDFCDFINQFSPKGVGFRIPYSKDNFDFEVYVEPLFSNLNNLFVRVGSGTSVFNSTDEINNLYQEIKETIKKYNSFFTE